MRYISIPEDVPVTGISAHPVPVSFKTWLGETVLLDPKLGKTAKDLMMAADLLKRLESAEDVLELSDAEWSLVKDVVEEPSGGYNTAVAIQLTCFLRAFLEAPTTQP